MSLVWLGADAIEEVRKDFAVIDQMMEVGHQVAAAAADMAPKKSGDGARSIHPEIVDTADGPEVRVSWDREHFYMGFAELGTVHQPATPFLRPALDRFR